jgi:hypothetical protein
VGGGYNIQFILYPYGSHFGKWARIQATKIFLNYIWCGIFCFSFYAISKPGSEFETNCQPINILYLAT